MNIVQRVILIVGAVLFVTVLLTAPKYLTLEGGGMVMHLMNDGDEIAYGKVLYPTVDEKLAAVRGAAVIGATVLLYFAFGTKARDGNIA